MPNSRTTPPLRRRTRRKRALAPIVTAIGVVTLLAATVVVSLRVEQSTDVPDRRNGRAFIQDNLWTTDEGQFAVWVGEGDRPLIGRRVADDEWDVADLEQSGADLDAPVEDDLHNVLVVATDPDGRVHVAGNMHSDPWRGVRADAATAFGNEDSWRPDPLSSNDAKVTYPRFVSLDDALLLFRRSVSDDGAAIVVDRLGPGQREWESVGVVIDARGTDEGPYLHSVAVDENQTLHTMVVWRTGAGRSGNGDLTYASSPDGGRSWLSADGAELGATVTHDESEPIGDPPPGWRWLNQGGLVADGRGSIVAVTAAVRGADRRLVVHRLQDGDWRRTDLPGDLLDGRPTIATFDGEACLIGVKAGWLRTVALDGERLGRRRVRVGEGWEPTFDRNRWRRDGIVEILVPLGDDPDVVRISACD